MGNNPLILSLSKDELNEKSPDTEWWFDKLTMSGLLPVPLILSLSKDELNEKSPDTEWWFDKLTMSGYCWYSQGASVSLPEYSVNR